MKKKVIIISYHFPPSSSTGAIRPMKFVKYLREFEWQPFVLTCKNPFDFGAKKNEALLDEIPKGIQIFRTTSFEPLNYIWRKQNTNEFKSRIDVRKSPHSTTRSNFSILGKLKGLVRDILTIPDRGQGWIPFAFFSGLRIIKKENIDVIYATTPPPSAIVVGYLLSKFTGLPLVIDYRDPWNQAWWAAKNFKFFENINRCLEEAVHKHAKGVISVSDKRKEELYSEYPIDKNKHMVITNGYDSEEMRHNNNGHFDKFTFIHAGSLYGDTSTADFVTAIEDIARYNANFRKDVKALFIRSRPQIAAFDRLEKEGIVEYKDFLPRRECLDVIAKSHVLLLFLEKGDFSTGCIPLKLFDYMMFKRPILGILPAGEARTLLEKTKIGVVVEPGQREMLQSTISMLYQQYKEDKLSVQTDYTLIKQYGRKELTRQLAGLFDKVVQR